LRPAVDREAYGRSAARLAVLGLFLAVAGCRTTTPPPLIPPFTPLPTPKPTPPPTPPKPLPPKAPKTTGKLEVPRLKEWRYIVIHHSGTDSGSAKKFDQFHRNVKHWDSLGYHFVIGNGHGSRDGEIEVGPRWVAQQHGAHTATSGNAYNNYGIGICMVGNFDAKAPTPAQMQAITDLVAYLQDRCKISNRNIKLHRDCKDTRCPGRKFTKEMLLARLPNRASGPSFWSRDSLLLNWLK